jgi:hypothetical protein
MGSAITKAPSISVFVALGLIIVCVPFILFLGYYQLPIWLDCRDRRYMLFSGIGSVALAIGLYFHIIHLKNSSGGKAGTGLYVSIVCIAILSVYILFLIWDLWCKTVPGRDTGFGFNDEKGVED